VAGERRGTKTHQWRNRRRGKGEVKAAVITESPNVKEWELYLWGFHFPVWAGFLGFGLFFPPSPVSAHKLLPRAVLPEVGAPSAMGGSEGTKAGGCRASPPRWDARDVSEPRHPPSVPSLVPGTWVASARLVSEKGDNFIFEAERRLPPVPAPRYFTQDQRPGSRAEQGALVPQKPQ